jgi:glycosyltransferase involved in cell wall biosynthesis
MDERPTIALVTDAIAPFHRGGKEQRYQELSTRLSERADVHVYTMKWWQGPRTRRDGAITYHAISPLLPLYSGGRRSIKQAIVFALCCLRLAFASFDALEADHMPYMQLISLKLVSLLKRRRLVVTWHECWGPAYWREYLGPAGLIGWMCERLAMRLPDLIIAASPETARRLEEYTGGQTPVVVAPNGIDLDVIDRVAPADNRADLVVVGRLLPHKRLDLLFDALAILKQEGMPTTAHVVGSGPQLASLREHAVRSGVDELVEFDQGIADQAALYAALKAARTAVFPSEREGFGIAVLEALACGVPVITTSAPDNLARHLVERADGAGLVCEPTPEALAEAIRASLQRGERGDPDREWLREYDWAAITESVATALA